MNEATTTLTRADRLDHRPVLGWQAQFVAKRRTCDPEQPAGAALGQAGFAGERNLPAPRLRAYHFRWLISWMPSLASSRSGKTFLSRAFSPSNARNRLMSCGESSPKCLRQA